MKLPLIKVRANFGEREEHIVGTDPHDRLYIGVGGALQYLNTQSMAGTEFYHESGYSFVGVDMTGWTFAERSEIELAPLERVIELVKANMTQSEKAEVKSYYALVKGRGSE